MTLGKIFWVFGLAFLSMTSSISAQTETEPLYSNDNWRLDLNDFDGGNQSCESRTVNSQGYVFSLITWSDGDYIIRFSYDDWSYGEVGLIQYFMVQIDQRGPWSISGNKYRNIMQEIVTPPSSSFEDFIVDMKRGDTLFLRSQGGLRIASFSLTGIATTLEQHAICERRILNGVSSIDQYN